MGYFNSYKTMRMILLRCYIFANTNKLLSNGKTKPLSDKTFYLPLLLITFNLLGYSMYFIKRKQITLDTNPLIFVQ